MGGGAFPKVPDYRIYKVSDAPELVKLEEKLAKHGLKDPWIRNEVWRYTLHGTKGTTQGTRMARSLLLGLPLALVVTSVIIGTEKLYHRAYPPAHHHH